jgi:transporter family-2 protein
MEVLLALLGAGSGGGALAAGLAISARLQRHADGPVATTLVNFVVGFAILSTLLALGLAGGFALGRLPEAPLWAFFGGVCGAAYVTLSLVAVSRMGLATATISIVLGQVAFSMVIDNFGLLGIPERPIGPTEALGAGLLVGAVILTRLSNGAGDGSPYRAAKHDKGRRKRHVPNLWVRRRRFRSR